MTAERKELNETKGDRNEKRIYYSKPHIIAIISGLNCDKKLTREKASKMIVKKVGFPVPVIGEWELKCPDPGYWDGYRGLLQDLRAFEEKGWLTISYKQAVIGMYSRYIATLTPEGEKVFEKEGRYFIKAKSAERVFVAVTGIVMQDIYAEVEYTWKYNPTEIGRIARAWVKIDDEIHKATARFKLYDDGWRIESLKE